MGLISTKHEVQSSRSSVSAIRDLNRDFERLLALICGCINEFSLYDTSKIAVSISRSRRNGRAGTLAYVVPLRYVGGARERKGRRWGIAGIYSYESTQLDRDQPNALYIMTFLVPKFFSLKPRDRLETLVHELYHLHPSMRGDLRRFAAPHLHHGPTPAAYHRKVKELCAEALGAVPNLEQHPLLSLNETQVGHFRGKRFNIPKHTFKPKPFATFLSAMILAILLIATASHAARVPVVIIKPGAIRVAPQESAGVEVDVKRGDRFEAFKLSEDRQWVWVGNRDVKGWVHRAQIQTAGSDRHLGLQGAYVDPNIPNKLGEKKVDPKETPENVLQETDQPLQTRNEYKRYAAAPTMASPSDLDADEEALWRELQKEEAGGDVEPPAALVTSETPPPVPVVVSAGKPGELDLRSDLEENPSEEQLADMKLSPEELSHLEEGEKVSKAQVRAQSRLSPLRRNDFNFKAEGAAASAGGVGVVTWEETFDIERDRSTVLIPGKLFERPDEQSRRYGILEEGDEVLPLAHTVDGKWQRVRLQETGEEGWFPAVSIKVTQADHVTYEILRRTAETHVGWGSRGQGLGGGLGYYFALGYDEKNRHWSVGGDFSFLSGEDLSFGTAQYQSSYFGVTALARYNMPSESSRFVAVIEGGVGYFQTLISTDGIAEDVLLLNGLTSQASRKFLPVFGLGVKYGIAKHFDMLTLVRFQLSSSAHVYAALGVGGNF